MNKDVIRFLAERGVKVQQNEDIAGKLEVWSQWYRGRVDSFHSYKLYSGKKTWTKERLSLNMASRVCQRWADLLLNEKVEITCSDAYTEQRLSELLRDVNFFVRGNNLLETAFALGGGFFIEYFDGEATRMKYITQDYLYPITYDSGRLIEAAFASRKTIDGKQYTYLETHMLGDSGEYVVDNVLLYDDKGGVREVDESFYDEHGIIPKWETHSREPLFQQVRPNVANRDDFNSPFGTSVYAGATDILKTIDLIYDSAYKEFLLGKKRIFVQDGVSRFNVDRDTGELVNVFDPQDEVFYHLPDSDDPNAPPLMESNLALRVAEHDAELQTQLNLLSQSVGMGSDGFKWERGSAQTATAIVSQNSELFRTLKKHELLLRDTVIQMARGLLFVEMACKGDTKLKIDTDITINFDDSIIEDTAEIRRQALLELSAGLIDNIEYYKTVYKMSEEQATAFAASIAERAPAPTEEAEPEM